MDNVEADRRHHTAARRLLATKLAVAEALPAGYAQDVALGILLNLFIRRADGTASTHRSICEAVPNTSVSVAERWIKALEQDRLVFLGNGAQEPTQPLVALTQHGLDVVRAMLVGVADVERREAELGSMEPYARTLRRA